MLAVILSGSSCSQIRLNSVIIERANCYDFIPLRSNVHPVELSDLIADVYKIYTEISKIAKPVL